LRRADQIGAALLGGAALVALAVYYVALGQWRGGWIDVDAAAPAPIRFQVDINQAEASELLLLPEIGDALAARIVAERRANGPYRRHDDLRRVRGIGPKTLDRIRPYLRPIPSPEDVAGR
jgi:competence protein ComEA